MAVNCPASPEENTFLGWPVSYPKWFLALVTPRHCARLCKATVLSTPLSHSRSLISFLANIMGFYTMKSPTDTGSQLMRFPHHSCTAVTSFLPHVFPPSPPPQHHHPVPFTTSLYCHKSEVSSGAKCDTEP